MGKTHTLRDLKTILRNISRQKSLDLKGNTATNDAKLMEWKSNENTRAELIVNELKGKGLSLDWVDNILFIIDTG